jgi:hypothetical protein
MVCGPEPAVRLPNATLIPAVGALVNAPTSASATSLKPPPFRRKLPGTYVVLAGMASVNVAACAVPLPVALTTI